MCQISVTNLHDVELNRKLFLIMGSIGSPVHDDGWGFSDSNGKIWKCSLPMYLTSDAGEVLKKHVKSSKITVGHIRQASAQIPVTVKNAHPFNGEEISFVHNGKLIPYNEKDFQMEEDVEEIDPKTQEVRIKSVKKSDSKIFFEHFLNKWKEFSEELDEKEKFLKVFQSTMDDFYGKFAMVFVIHKRVYICRGNTADLYITRLLEKAEQDAKVIGWAINTDRNVLDVSAGLLSNLEQLQGNSSLYFTSPKILDANSVYMAENFDVTKIGEVKENIYKSTSSYQKPQYENNWNQRGLSSGNPSTGSTGVTDRKNVDVKMKKLYEQVYKFMDGYSLSPLDIQNFFLILYGASLLEVTEHMLEHFCRYAIPNFGNYTNKEIRKNLRQALCGYHVSLHRYAGDLKYPWMLSTKETQIKFVKVLESKKEK